MAVRLVGLSVLDRGLGQSDGRFSLFAMSSGSQEETFLEAAVRLVATIEICMGSGFCSISLCDIGCKT